MYAIYNFQINLQYFLHPYYTYKHCVVSRYSVYSACADVRSCLLYLRCSLSLVHFVEILLLRVKCVN